MLFSPFFLMIDLYFLIRAVIAQILNPTDELAIFTETPTNQAKVGIKSQLIAEIKKENA